MAELSLDFKNEIINETINEKRRYVMTENEDGTVSFTDTTSYSQTGTKYGAEEVIEEREAINQNTNVIGGDAYDSSKSYAADDYFIYNNQLCKALTAISAGTSLSEGTNYEVTSLENEIAGLNGKTVFPVIYYDTNTDRRIEQNRANAIRHVIETSINNRSVGFVCIRYGGGYYIFYIMFKATDICVIEVNPYNSESFRANVWRFDNDGYEINSI